MGDNATVVVVPSRTDRSCSMGEDPSIRMVKRLATARPRHATQLREGARGWLDGRFLCACVESSVFDSIEGIRESD